VARGQRLRSFVGNAGRPPRPQRDPAAERPRLAPGRPERPQLYMGTHHSTLDPVREFQGRQVAARRVDARR
ncbi:MAG: hypothetical protein PVJ43_10640, partial [Gemmatimonadales bacterium]